MQQCIHNVRQQQLDLRHMHETRRHLAPLLETVCSPRGLVCSSYNMTPCHPFHNNVGHLNIVCSFQGVATFSNTDCSDSDGPSLYNVGDVT